MFDRRRREVVPDRQTEYNNVRGSEIIDIVAATSPISAITRESGKA